MQTTFDVIQKRRISLVRFSTSFFRAAKQSILWLVCVVPYTLAMVVVVVIIIIITVMLNVIIIIILAIILIVFKISSRFLIVLAL